MKESTLLEMKKKIESLTNVVQYMINELKNELNNLVNKNQHLYKQLEDEISNTSQLDSKLCYLELDCKEQKKQLKDYKCIIDLFENDKKSFEQTILKLRNKVKELQEQKNNNLIILLTP